MMKKLFPLLGLLLFCSSPADAISYAGNKATNTNVGFGQTVAATITGQTSGNTNIVSVFWCGDPGCTTDCTGDTAAITDASLNTYPAADLRLNASINRFQCLAVFHASSIATSASNAVLLTITSGSSTSYATILVSEWNGLLASPKDQTGTVDLGSSASPLSVVAGGATSQASELVYTLGVINAGTLAAGASYTALSAPVTSILDEYQIVSSIATYTATETFGSASGKGGVLVTFKGALAPGTGGGGIGGKAGMGGKAGTGD